MYFWMFSATENADQQKLFFNLTKKTSLIFEKWFTGFHSLNLNFSFWHTCLWEFTTTNHWSLLVARIYRRRSLNFRIRSQESGGISRIPISVARIWPVLPESGMPNLYETSWNLTGCARISSLVIFARSNRNFYLQNCNFKRNLNRIFSNRKPKWILKLLGEAMI
jgi:hypothetical protein